MKRKAKDKNKSSRSKKVKEVYIPKKGLMGDADDYHIYNMQKKDIVIGFLIGAIAGMAVAYVFFRTLSVMLIAAFAVGILFIKPYHHYLHKKRMKGLLLQFKDMLESISASYSAGLTTVKAFEDAYKEMKELYGVDADITKELGLIVSGLQNNLNIEDLLLNFADRCGLDDVNSFANVFEVCNRKGGNLQHIVSETRGVINDKIEIEMEIQTMVAAGKNELNIMMVMPLAIMLSMRGLGGGVTANNLPNICVKLFVMGIFALAYKIGSKIVEIKL